MANPLKIPGKVALVKKHDEGVFTLIIEPARRIPRFKAGQFLHLTIDEYDPCGGYWPDSRVFSIASAPDSDVVELVYSVKGRYTSRMSMELQTGSRVWLKMPYGDFTLASSVKSDQDIVLVAGGTGISPYISFLRTLVGTNFATVRKIHLIYGIRNERHFLFPDVIETCLSSNSSYSMDVFIENQTGPIPLKSVIPSDGMIALEHIVSSGNRLKDAVYFLSGPPAMINAFNIGLISSGIAKENIKIDAWE